MISASALRIPPRSFAVFSTQRNCQWLVSRVLHASGGGGAKSFSIRHLTTTAVTAAMKETDAEEFLAAESVSWSSLGISNPISTALVNAGLPRPSLVQACCTPIILSGSDVVVAAETGSGKTHGYLVPLIDRLSKTVDTSKDAAENKHQIASIVLCPNMMLCEQVAAMANSLCDDSNKPLLNTAVVSGRQGFPTKCPDILVSTPVALLNHLHSMDHERHKRNEFIHGVKYVVFDEADLLLCGSFQNQVIRLINMLRFDERLLSQSQGSVSNGQNAEPVAELDTLGTEVDFPMDAAEDSDDETTSNQNTDVESNTPSQRDWRRVRKTYARSKQYIFVAATLPLNGKKTAGGILKRMFPDAKWVNGSYLHRQNPRLEQRWVEVTVDTQVAELTKAVTSNISSHGTTRTMIFANTVDAAETIAKILRVSGIQCILYHRNISPDEQMQNISDFRENGGIFVCTDAAARGLDIPNVSHVIQAEFASSAVDFLHRVGRTARAGQHGLITSLFTESNRDLVAAVRRAEQQGLPVENAFSRKRSFRNKLKKQGKSLVQV